MVDIHDRRQNGDVEDHDLRIAERDGKCTEEKLAPFTLARLERGKNPVVAQRPLSDQDFYALRPVNLILPTLGPERRATYSPFLPISPRTGVVLQVPIVEHDAKAGTVSYDDPETRELAALRNT